MTILYVDNAQFLVAGPVVDGLNYAQNPSVIQYITDLTITASLYTGRNINTPSTQPGSLVTAFGTGGSITLPYVANGFYRVLVPAFTIATGPYALVFDAPISGSGYQLHIEQVVDVQTRQT